MAHVLGGKVIPSPGASSKPVAFCFGVSLALEGSGGCVQTLDVAEILAYPPQNTALL